MIRFWTFFLRNSQFTLLLMIAVTIFGLISLNNMPKESTPEIKLPMGIVMTVLPGANATDVEKLVTNELETPLKNNLENVKSITSTSKSGVSAITVEFSADADIKDSLDSLKDEVNKAKSALPNDATEPQVIEIDFAKEPVVTFAVAADVPQGVLLDLSKKLETELEQLSGVSDVKIQGVQDREVYVLVRKEALAAHNLLVTDIARSIAAQNVALPSGSVNISGEEYAVRFEGNILSTEEIPRIPIAAPGGVPLTIGDVATVVDGYAESQVISRLSVNGEPSRSSFTVDVYKKPNAQITTVGTTIKEAIDELRQPGALLDGINVSITLDRADLLAKDLHVLSKTALETVVLVVGLLALVIGWREALVAGISVPLSFLLAFIFMEYVGNTINFISLFALILSTGIIVDSAIVIVDGVEAHYRAGNKTKFAAAVEALSDYSAPLISGTLTTVAVFFPLLNISGVTGEFIASIPYTLIFVLMASIFVALAFTPLTAVLLLRDGPNRSAFAEKRTQYIHAKINAYRNWLLRFLRNTQNTKAIKRVMFVFFIGALLLPISGAVRVIFFPSENSEYAYIDMELPSGSSLSDTDKEMRKVEEYIYASGVSGIASFTTTVGQSSPYANAYEGARTEERLGNIFMTLNIDEGAESSATVAQLQDILRPITTSSIVVGEIQGGGPPTGSPIVITLSGTNFESLDASANTVSALLKTIPGTENVTATTKDNSLEFALALNRHEGISQGITAMTVAQAINSSLAGTDATHIKLIDEDIPINVRMDFSGKHSPEASNEVGVDALRYMPIGSLVSQSGEINGQMLLGSFVTITPTESRTIIRHEDGERIAKVTSDISDGANTREIVSLFKARAEQELKLQEGVRMSIGGENEEVDKSFVEMFYALVLGLLGMFAVIIIEFNSVRHTLYLLLTVPLALIGVLTGLLIMGSALSFPSMVGFIALAGIIVNHAIILIDVMNRKYKEAILIAGSVEKVDLAVVVADATALRLRPVLLTGVTTVVGTIPLVFADALWAPLAYAIIFGLSFATIVTLVFIPALYHSHPGRHSDIEG